MDEEEQLFFPEPVDYRMVGWRMFVISEYLCVGAGDGMDTAEAQATAAGVLKVCEADCVSGVEVTEGFKSFELPGGEAVEEEAVFRRGAVEDVLAFDEVDDALGGGRRSEVP